MNADWGSGNSSHKEHRQGINADVNLTAYDQVGRSISLSTDQTDLLWDLISDLTGNEPLDESERNH